MATPDPPNTKNKDTAGGHSFADTPDDTLLSMGENQSKDCDLLAAAIVSRGPAILDKAMERLLAQDSPFQRCDGLLYAVIPLCKQADRPIPEALDTHLSRSLRQFTSPPALIQRALLCLDTARARRLLLRETAYARGARSTFGAVHDRSLYDGMLNTVSNIYSVDYHLIPDYTAGFACGGEYAWRFLETALGNKPKAPCLMAAIGALATLDIDRAMPVVLAHIGHASKGVHQTALAALEAHPDRALAHIETLLTGRRKATRAAAVEFLAALPPSEARDAAIDAARPNIKHKDVLAALDALPKASEDSPEATLAAIRAALTEADWDHLRGLWTRWTGTPAKDMLAETQIIETYGSVLMMAWADTLKGYAVTAHSDHWRQIFTLLKDDPLAPWAAVQVACGLKVWPQEQVVPLLAVFGQAAVEPICTLALGNPISTAFIDLLAELDPSAGTAALVESLGHKKPAIRAAARNTLTLAGEAVVEEVAVGLMSRRKDARIEAARTLETIGSPKASDALAKAIDKEKNQSVSTALGRALASCAPHSAPDFALGDKAALETWLSKGPHTAPPSFVSLEDLPKVRWREGGTLEGPVLAGLLHQLSLESDENPNQNARALRQHLDRHALAVLGKALIKAWEQANKPAGHLWLWDQIAISANNVWIGNEVKDLIKTFNWNNANGTRLLRVLSRHGSVEARSGLRYWSTQMGVLYKQYGFRKAYVDATQRLMHDLGVSTTPDLSPWISPDIQKQIECRPERIGFQTGAVKQMTFSGHHFVFRVEPVPFPEPGRAATALKVVLETLNTADPQGLVEARRARDKDQRTLDKLTETLLEGGLHAQLWTPSGWRRIFAKHPITGALGRALIFETVHRNPSVTPPKAPIRFVLGKNGKTPRNIEGKTVHFDDDALIRVIAPDELGDPDPWHAALEAARTQSEARVASGDVDLAVQTNSGLSRLRDLLYETPSEETWTAICAVMDAWPDHDLETAFDYALPHLSKWDTLWRQAPVNWALSLVSDQHPKRLEFETRGLRISSTPDPRLTLCNALTLSGTNLKRPDSARIAGATVLYHIAHLTLDRLRVYAGSEAKLAMASLPALRHVFIDFVKIRGKGIGELGAAPFMQDLETLSFSFTDLGPNALAALGESGALKGLASLNLIWLGDLSAEGLTRLFSSEHAFGLSHLHLHQYNLEDDWFDALARSPNIASLQSINADLSNGGRRGIRRLAKSPHASDALRTHILDTILANGS